jgi:hypothetical protein
METDAHVKGFSEYLAGLGDEERNQALAQARVLAVSAAPSENVGEPPVRTLAEYLRDKIPEPPSLVMADVVDDLPPTGQVVRGAVSLLTSPGGKGKTVLSLNRIVRWAAGLPLFDGLETSYRPREPLKTLVIENEGAAGFFQSRLERMIDHFEFDPAERRLVDKNVLIWGDGGWSSLKLDDGTNMDLVRRAMEKYEPDILFMEPLRGLHVQEENDNTAMAALLDTLHGIARDYKGGIMLTHHERKSGVGESTEEMWAVRGAAALTDLAGVVERFKSVKNGSQREVSNTKSRFGPAPGPARMKFDPVAWRYDYVPESELDMQILSTLEAMPGEWYSAEHVAELVGETLAVSRTALNSLASDSKIKKMKGDQGTFQYRSAAGDNTTGVGVA